MLVSLASAYSDAFDREHVSSVALSGYAHSIVDEKVRKATLSLFGASALLWLIACVNATSLVVARYAGRQREFAVRGALGASRLHITATVDRNGAPERIVLPFGHQHGYCYAQIL